MKKKVYLVLLLSLLVIAAGETPPPQQPAEPGKASSKPDVTGPEAPDFKGDDCIKPKPSMLYVREGKSGEWKTVEDGSLMLTMYDVLPHVSYFSMRPFTNAGKIQVGFFCQQLSVGRAG